MWQRIQTLYLAIASGLLVAMYFQGYQTPYLILWSMALASQLLALVCLKSRTLQLRLSNLAGLLLVGLQIWMGVVFFTSEPRPLVNMTYVFPIVAAILDFLASRGILHDELLVRSASRLRASKRK
ncbi:MAG: DUF4293 domain-containing protein [Bacteroidales bacterium]|nr:DUF4293 domain-containing protein [Bacteroidales bacterium]